MAKSKSSFSLTACITLITSVLAFVMFFLPNVFYKVLGITETTTTSSGWNMFMGVFSLDNASAATSRMFQSIEGLKVVNNGLAYVIGILLALSAIAILACAVISLLKILGMKVDFSLVGKIGLVASALMIIAFVMVLIRFGQMNADAETMSIGYGLIVGLIASIATAVVPMVLKK